MLDHLLRIVKVTPALPSIDGFFEANERPVLTYPAIFVDAPADATVVISVE